MILDNLLHYFPGSEMLSKETFKKHWSINKNVLMEEGTQPSDGVPRSWQ